MNTLLREAEGRVLGLGVAEVGGVEQESSALPDERPEAECLDLLAYAVGAVGEHEHRQPQLPGAGEQGQHGLIDHSRGVGPLSDSGVGPAGVRADAAQMLDRELTPPGMAGATGGVSSRSSICAARSEEHTSELQSRGQLV